MVNAPLHTMQALDKGAIGAWDMWVADHMEGRCHEGGEAACRSDGATSMPNTTAHMALLAPSYFLPTSSS